MNGLRNIVQMAHTANSLEQVLKEQWTSEALMKAFDLEVEGATLDAQMAMNRQTRQQTGRYASGGQPVWITTPQPQIFDMSPKAVHARRARQDQMLQLYAAKKRGNKPSYRQRQKNGRAGRKR